MPRPRWGGRPTVSVVGPLVRRAALDFDRAGEFSQEGMEPLIEFVTTMLTKVIDTWLDPATQPFDHQIVTSAWMLLREQAHVLPNPHWSFKTRGGFVANDMGTGKTLSVILTLLVDLVIHEAGFKVRPTLVVCPPSLVEAVWFDEMKVAPRMAQFVCVVQEPGARAVPDAPNGKQPLIVITSYAQFFSKEDSKDAVWALWKDFDNETRSHETRSHETRSHVSDRLRTRIASRKAPAAPGGGKGGKETKGGKKRGRGGPEEDEEPPAKTRRTRDGKRVPVEAKESHKAEEEAEEEEAHKAKKRAKAAAKKTKRPMVWGRLVLDEAQIAKNPATNTHKHLSKLTSRVTWNVSATPCDNKEQNLWNLAKLAGVGADVAKDTDVIRNYFMKRVDQTHTGACEVAYVDVRLTEPAAHMARVLRRTAKPGKGGKIATMTTLRILAADPMTMFSADPGGEGDQGDRKTSKTAQALVASCLAEFPEPSAADVADMPVVYGLRGKLARFIRELCGSLPPDKAAVLGLLVGVKGALGQGMEAAVELVARGKVALDRGAALEVCSWASSNDDRLVGLQGVLAKCLKERKLAHMTRCVRAASEHIHVPTELRPRLRSCVEGLAGTSPTSLIRLIDPDGLYGEVPVGVAEEVMAADDGPSTSQGGGAMEALRQCLRDCTSSGTNPVYRTPVTLAAMRIIRKTLSSGPTEKVLVFTHYTAEIVGLEQALAADGIGHLKFCGNMSDEDRNHNVKTIGSDPDVRVLIINIACGGQGLNLQVARTVVFLSGDWNPRWSF